MTLLCLSALYDTVEGDFSKIIENISLLDENYREKIFSKLAKMSRLSLQVKRVKPEGIKGKVLH